MVQATADATCNDTVRGDEDLFVPDLEDPDPFGVSVTNGGDTEFRARHLQRWYRIAPGESLMVPWTAACLWCGDPRKIDIDKKHRARHKEYQRLRIRYGVYENDHVWDVSVPKLVVHDIQGRRIPMVIDDPTGDRFSGSVDSSATSTEILQRAVLQAQQQIQVLQQKIAETESAEAATVAGRHIQPDVPKQRKRPTSRSRQVIEDEG